MRAACKPLLHYNITPNVQLTETFEGTDETGNDHLMKKIKWKCGQERVAMPNACAHSATWYLVSGSVCLSPVLYKSCLYHKATEHMQKDCCTSCSNFWFLVFKFLYLLACLTAASSTTLTVHLHQCNFKRITWLILLGILPELELGS